MGWRLEGMCTINSHLPHFHVIKVHVLINFIYFFYFLEIRCGSLQYIYGGGGVVRLWADGIKINRDADRGVLEPARLDRRNQPIKKLMTSHLRKYFKQLIFLKLWKFKPNLIEPQWKSVIIFLNHTFYWGFPSKIPVIMDMHVHVRFNSTSWIINGILLMCENEGYSSKNFPNTRMESQFIYLGGGGLKELNFFEWW